MRLLIATRHATTVGGVETYLKAVLPPLVRRASAVALLTRGGGPTGADDLPAVDGVTWLPVADETPDTVLDAARSWQPDVVYTHGMGLPSLDAALAEPFPAVAFMHNYDATCASGYKRHGAPHVTPCSRPLGLACLALWGPRRCGGQSPRTALRMYGEARRRQSTLHQCEAVVVASQHMVDEMTRNGVPASRVHHAPLFPTAGRPDAAPPPARAFSGRVLYVGRLTALKGWHHLLEALPQAARALGRPLTLVVAGDGPDRAAFEEACVRRGVSCDFRGWLTGRLLERELRAADALVVPSLWPEPFGLVGLDAACVGLPAVAYGVGGIPEWLVTGQTGELAVAAHPEPSALAEALARMLAAPEHWQRLRVGAWQSVGKFTLEAHLERLWPILAAAARPRTPRGSAPPRAAM